MFKKEFGISVYPEKTTLSETKRYISKAKEYGYKNLFISFVQFKTWKKFSQVKGDYIKVIKYAKKLGYYIVADISKTALSVTKTSLENLSWFVENGIDSIRLDGAVLAHDVAKITHLNNLDVQLNMSMNDHFIDNVLDYQPVKFSIGGIHNFYSQKNTGLSWDFFVKSTTHFVQNSVRTAAFIGSSVAKYGPMESEIAELVTVERHRLKPIRTQAKELVASNLITDILIANQFASDKELKDVASIDVRTIELDIIPENNLTSLEEEILFKTPHFSRGDQSGSFIRSTVSRKMYEERGLIKPHNIQPVYNRGDVIIINQNDHNYQKELIIIKEDNYEDFDLNQANLVGKIVDYDLDLFSLIKPWDYFKFKNITTKSKKNNN